MAAISDGAHIAGREREHELLRAALTDAFDGYGRIVLVSGPAGIGKTTLAEVLAAEARASGALVLTGGCVDFGAPPPYGPWMELEQAYRAATGRPGPWPDGGESDVRNPAALVAGVDAFLHEVSAVQPLVLVLEDLHWSGPASVDLLPRAPGAR